MAGENMSDKKRDRGEVTCRGVCIIKRNDESIKCFKCETELHAKCSGLSVEEYSILKLNDQSGLVYLCSTCLISCKNTEGMTEKSENNNFNELKETINILSTTINKRLSDIEDKMKKTAPSNATETECQIIIGKDNAKESVPSNFIDNPIKHKLLIQPLKTDGDDEDDNNGYDKETWASITKKELSAKLAKIPVDGSFLNKKGAGCLSFPSKASRDEAAENLKNEFQLKRIDQQKKNIFPKIKISGLNKDAYGKNSKQDLRSDILSKNPIINEAIERGCMLEIVFIQETEESNYNFAVAKIDLEMMKLIERKGNFLNIHFSRCRVTKRIHVLQCYTCQKFGHKAGDEKCLHKGTNINVCMYCSENHKASVCPNRKAKDKHQCANCLNSNIESIKVKAIGHSTSSQECPIFKNELNRVLDRTIGLSKQMPLQKNWVVT